MCTSAGWITNFNRILILIHSVDCHFYHYVTRHYCNISTILQRIHESCYPTQQGPISLKWFKWKQPTANPAISELPRIESRTEHMGTLSCGRRKERERQTDNEQNRERDWVTCSKFCREPVATVTGKVAGSCGWCYHGNHPRWPSDAGREIVEEGLKKKCVYELDGNEWDR